METSVGIGLATILVMTIASSCAWLADTYLLIPIKLSYLRTLVFILIISFIVQLAEIVMYKISSAIYHIIGVFLPLITINCAVLGVVLTNANLEYNFFQSTLHGFFSAIGFSLVIILFASIRERLENADVPMIFRGSAIALVTAGLMSLSFMGFNGLSKL